MIEQPHQKMVIELNGQEADLIIRSLYRSIIDAAINDEKDKLEMYAKLMEKISQSKQKIHEDWMNDLLRIHGR